MKKRISILAGLLLLAAVVCAATVFVMHKWNGSGIVLDQREVDDIVRQNEIYSELFDAEPRTREDAEAYVLRRETLYQAALDAGYTVTEQEVDDYVQLQIDMASIADNREHFDAFLTAMGMTSEEYWSSQRSVLAKELLYGKYLDDGNAPPVHTGGK